MKALSACVVLAGVVVLVLGGCSKQEERAAPPTKSTTGPMSSEPFSKTITICDNELISGGVSKGSYVAVDGFRYVNIAVQYEQNAADEEPLSLGVMFAQDASGKLSSRRYFSYDQNVKGDGDPQMITVSGKNCWHGSPHNRSSYIVRVPVMGPYLQVFPFNWHREARHLSIALYLTK